MEWSIQQVARLAGTTSRTLRHYDDIGLLKPSSVAPSGYRCYDESALATLQRILLLRELGLGLSSISDVLAGQAGHVEALETHAEWLRRERERIDRQLESVETTIRKMRGGEQLMAEEMLNGFDHTQYKDEVEKRWGKQAYAAGDRWWRDLSQEARDGFAAEAGALGAAWQDAASRGVDPVGDEAQALAKRQFEWLASIPGTPGAGAGGPSKEYFTGLAELYVADERFAANYGGVEGARFVRDAMVEYADRSLS